MSDAILSQVGGARLTVKIIGAENGFASTVTSSPCSAIAWTRLSNSEHIFASRRQCMMQPRQKEDRTVACSFCSSYTVHSRRAGTSSGTYQYHTSICLLVWYCQGRYLYHISMPSGRLLVGILVPYQYWSWYDISVLYQYVHWYTTVYLPVPSSGWSQRYIPGRPCYRATRTFPRSVGISSSPAGRNGA